MITKRIFEITFSEDEIREQFIRRANEVLRSEYEMSASFDWETMLVFKKEEGGPTHMEYITLKTIASERETT